MIKKIYACSICVLLIFMIAACDDVHYLKEADCDRFGPWGVESNIVIEHSEGWRPIEASAFQLGKVYSVTRKNGVVSDVLSYGTYPSIDGNQAIRQIVMEFASSHLPMSLQEAYYFTNLSSSIERAYKNLVLKQPAEYERSYYPAIKSMDLDHPVDVLISRDLTEQELSFADQNNVGLMIKPICYDAFVFMTHNDNPVENLTKDEVQAIYRGKITNWQQVGGLDEPIMVFQREKNTESQEIMQTMVMEGRRMQKPIVALATDREKGVAEYVNSSASLGYTYLSYARNLYVNQQIKLLSIDGVAPTPATIRDGSYPYAFTYDAAIRSDDMDNVGGKFQAWMISEEGQFYIEQAGYIPLE